MNRTVWLLLSVFCVLALAGGVGVARRLAAPVPDLRVGSKEFTEGVVLGELTTLLAEQAGGNRADESTIFDDPLIVEHDAAMGGTRLVFNALKAGNIDAYPEYSGTLKRELLADQNLETMDQVTAALDEVGIHITKPLGFENSYALGMRKEKARELGIASIADLKEYPDLRMGFTESFLNRGDGWPAVKEEYNLPQTNVRGLKHELAYKMLVAGELDVVDFYTTDAEIDYYDLQPLTDPQGVFPDYEAYIIYRDDVEGRYPAVVKRWNEFAGRLDETLMQQLNREVVFDRQPERVVAASLLGMTVNPPGWWMEVFNRTIEHLALVGVSMAAGMLLSIPLGYLAAKNTTLNQFVFGIVGIIQTVPALALLVFMIPVMGAVLSLVPLVKEQFDPAFPPAVSALFLYSLLPMVRNTYVGLTGISVPVQESAEALGLSSWAKLWRIELPLAAPSILAGVKTSMVLIIGFATLGGLIGAGGYGQPILTGIRLDRYDLILQGAVPAALMAIVAQFLFDVLEKQIIPRGLRLKRAT